MQVQEIMGQRSSKQSDVTWKNSSGVDAVQRLLKGLGRPEDQIRQDLVRVLDGLGIENLLSYRTPAGPADIYLPRRRTFIETKAVGLAENPERVQGRTNDETPYEQVARYLTAEKDDELGALFSDRQPDLPWTGVVTDGRIWHAWQFPHTYQTEAKCVFSGFMPQNETDFLQRIAPLLNAEPVGKPWIPANPLSLFEGALHKLQAIYKNISNARIRKTTNTKKHLWLDILRGSGMAPANSYAQEDLFIAHCFLVALARGVVHTLGRPDDDPDPRQLLRDGYPAWIIEIEPDRRWAQQLLDRIHSYDWRHTQGDVMRPLYEGFIEARDRRDFGEVYTPDWLAEMMVEEVLDNKWCDHAVSTALAVSHGQTMPGGLGVLDPTCGSGTFLYHCAKRILASKTARNLPPVQRSDVACRLIHGIDIHPVAVEFARATLLRALPATPSLGLSSMAIYQGDALILRQTDESSLFAPEDGEVLIRSPRGTEIRIPREFSDHPGFPGMLPRIVEAAMQGDPVPADIMMTMKNVEDRIIACHKSLTKIIQQEGNSVWSWYIQNILGPDRLARRKVDRIVANPPWVKLSHIQARDRKRELEGAAGKGKPLGSYLWVGGNQAPHFDIAQLFICHARNSYLNQPEADPAAWVTKASAIRAGSWGNFRDLHGTHISQTLDFSSAKVFGGGDARRSCVIFEVRSSSLGEDAALEAHCKNAPPQASMSWKEAQSLLHWKAPDSFPSSSSGYKAEGWRQGATITPKVLTVVDLNQAGSTPDTRNVTTAKSDKGKWRTVSIKSGEVPVRWVMPILTSGQLFPFLIAGFRTGIIPCGKDGHLLTSQEKVRENDFWRELDDLYQEHRGLGGNTPKNLLNRINYSNILSRQLPLRSQTDEWQVVYPASGDIMRAACMQAGAAVIDCGIYRRRMDSHAEASYLVAVLNAPSLEKAFRSARTSGRHFSKTPWENIPIPQWDKKNDVHKELSSLGETAEKIVREMELPTGQIAASKRIRKQLSEDGTFDEIDAQVKQILPRHVSR